MRTSMARKTPSGLWITVGGLLSNEPAFHAAFSDDTWICVREGDIQYSFTCFV